MILKDLESVSRKQIGPIGVRDEVDFGKVARDPTPGCFWQNVRSVQKQLEIRKIAHGKTFVND